MRIEAPFESLPTVTGGRGRIRTSEGFRQLIYSQPLLAAWVPAHYRVHYNTGASHTYQGTTYQGRRVMPAKWSAQEEQEKRDELCELYVRQNKTTQEIARLLGIAPNTVFDRLVRLRIPTRTQTNGKTSHNARVISIPELSGDLAEFCGIMLGDGHIGPAQIFITVNVKTDAAYIAYVQDLLERVFRFRPRLTAVKNASTVDLYVTSAYLVRELRKIGLHSTNKVRDQVGIPEWIITSAEHKRRFLRGFFDTDGSIYRLKHFNAVQMSFSNLSVPLLEGTRQLLLDLGYHPSRFSGHSVCLTRQEDIRAYIREIGFGNLKHLRRAQRFGVV